MPKVSVLMPVYKTNESYLKEAIESILDQTFTDFEFLILDDCPEDDREKIVKSFKDKRIKYSKNSHNIGISASRNKLIDMAKGEYLAVMDHDDISLPTRFEKQVTFLDTHPDVGVVGCKAKFISNNKELNNPTNDHDIKLSLMRNCAILHSSSMIRKSILLNNNIKYEAAFSPCEDYALWCRLIPFTNFYNLNNEPLFFYRDSQENTTYHQSEQMLLKTFDIQALAKITYPSLYEIFLLKAYHITKIRIFGFIPFLTIIRKGYETKAYLFGIILFVYCKRNIKLREK